MEAVALWLCLTPTVSPAAADLARFPPPRAVREWRDFSEGYRNVLRSHRALHPHRWQEIEQTQRLAALLWGPWEELFWAQENGADTGWGRERLDRLRELLGDDDWFAGRLPPPVPWWRFEEID